MNDDILLALPQLSSITRRVLNPGPEIPLPTRMNYPLVTCWTKAEYDSRKTQPTTGLETKTKRGKTKASDDPAPNEFIEDQNGVLISTSVSAAVKEKMRQLWQHLFNIGRLPPNFGATDSETLAWFRNEMYRAFPFLLFCAYHWKLDKLWKDTFSGWKPASPVAVEEEQEDDAEGEGDVDGAPRNGKRKAAPKGKPHMERPKGSKRQKQSSNNSGSPGT